MIKNILLSILLPFLFILSSCSGNDKNKIEKKFSLIKPSELYKNAMLDLNDQKYDEAQSKFKDINFQYPLSNEAIQSQTMLAFIDYLQMDYDEAIFKFDNIIRKYPSHKNLDYSYYMRALCYFEQIENEALDGKFNTEALNNFKQILNRFPDSEYAKDSKQKIIVVKENIAAKHMNIANFYLGKKKYFAAINRYKSVIEDHETSKFTPEALFKLTEIYYLLGMIDESKKTASVLGYNYPKSKWYKYSFELISPKKNKKTIFSKISNLINTNDKEN